MAGPSRVANSHTFQNPSGMNSGPTNRTIMPYYSGFNNQAISGDMSLVGASYLPQKTNFPHGYQNNLLPLMSPAQQTPQSHSVWSQTKVDEAQIFEQVIIYRALEEDEYPLTKALVLSRVDRINFEWRTMAFAHTRMELEPEEGVSKILHFTSSKRRDALIRLGLEFEQELLFAETKQGLLQLGHYLETVATSLRETLSCDVHTALLNCPNYRVTYAHVYGKESSYENVSQMLDRTHFEYGRIHYKDGFEKLKERAISELRKFNFRPNLAIVAEGVKYSLLFRDEKLVYSTSGRPVDTYVNAGKKQYDSFDGIQVYESHKFVMGENTERFDPMKFESIVGEYYLMVYQDHGDMCPYASTQRNIVLFDQSGPAYREISLLTAIEQSQIFNIRASRGNFFNANRQSSSIPFLGDDSDDPSVLQEGRYSDYVQEFINSLNSNLQRTMVLDGVSNAVLTKAIADRQDYLRIPFVFYEKNAKDGKDCWRPTEYFGQMSDECLPGRIVWKIVSTIHAAMCCRIHDFDRRFQQARSTLATIDSIENTDDARFGCGSYLGLCDLRDNSKNNPYVEEISFIEEYARALSTCFPLCPLLTDKMLSPEMAAMCTTKTQRQCSAIVEFVIGNPKLFVQLERHDATRADGIRNDRQSNAWLKKPTEPSSRARIGITHADDYLRERASAASVRSVPDFNSPDAIKSIVGTIGDELSSAGVSPRKKDTFAKIPSDKDIRTVAIHYINSELTDKKKQAYEALENNDKTFVDFFADNKKEFMGLLFDEIQKSLSGVVPAPPTPPGGSSSSTVLPSVPKISIGPEIDSGEFKSTKSERFVTKRVYLSKRFALDKNIEKAAFSKMSFTDQFDNYVRNELVKSGYKYETDRSTTTPFLLEDDLPGSYEEGRFGSFMALTGRDSPYDWSSGIADTQRVAVLSSNMIARLDLAERDYNEMEIGMLRAFCMSPVHLCTIRSMYNNNILIPFNAILFRPHILHETGSMIIMEGGTRAGFTAITNEDMRCNYDAQSKTMMAHFTVHAKPIVVNEAAVNVIHNVSFHRYIGGNNVEFFYNPEEFAQHSSNVRRPSRGSIVSALTSITDTRFCNPMDMTGTWNPNFFKGLTIGSTFEQSTEKWFHYETAPLMSAIFSLKKDNVFSKPFVKALNTSDLNIPYVNTLCWLGSFKFWDPSTKQFTGLQINTSPLGPTYIGCDEVRSGKRSSFHDDYFARMGLLSTPGSVH